MRNKILSISFSYATSLVSFLTTLLLARLLGAEAFGMVALGLAVGAFASPFINLGTDRVFVRDFLRTTDSNKRRALTHRNLLTRASMAVVVLFVILALAIVIGSTPRERTALTALFMWAALLGGYPTAWYDAIGKVMEQSALNLIEKVVALAFAIAIYSGPSWAAEPAVIGIMLLGTRVVSLGFQYGFWGKLSPGFPNSLRGLDKATDAGISIRITAVLLTSACVAYGNQLLLESRGDRFELGAFGIAFQVTGLVLLFQAQYLRLIAREIVFATEHPKLIVWSMLRHAGQLFGMSSALSIAAWAFMKWLPALLGDEQYGSIGDFALPLCAWAAVAGAGQVVSQYLVSVRGERAYLRIAAAGAVTSVGLGMMLIPDGGPRLVALILLIVHSMMICLQGVAVLRNADLPRRAT